MLRIKIPSHDLPRLDLPSPRQHFAPFPRSIGRADFCQSGGGDCEESVSCHRGRGDYGVPRGFFGADPAGHLPALAFPADAQGCAELAGLRFRAGIDELADLPRICADTDRHCRRHRGDGAAGRGHAVVTTAARFAGRGVRRIRLVFAAAPAGQSGQPGPGRRGVCAGGGAVLGAVYHLRQARLDLAGRASRGLGHDGGGHGDGAHRRRVFGHGPAGAVDCADGPGNRHAVQRPAVLAGNLCPAPFATRRVRHVQQRGAGRQRGGRHGRAGRTAEPDPVAGHRLHRVRVGDGGVGCPGRQALAACPLLNRCLHRFLACMSVLAGKF